MPNASDRARRFDLDARMLLRPGVVDRGVRVAVQGRAAHRHRAARSAGRTRQLRGLRFTSKVDGFADVEAQHVVVRLAAHPERMASFADHDDGGARSGCSCSPCYRYMPRSSSARASLPVRCRPATALRPGRRSRTSGRRRSPARWPREPATRRASGDGRIVEARSGIVRQSAVDDDEPAGAFAFHRHDAIQRGAGARRERPSGFDAQPRRGDVRARTRRVGGLRDRAHQRGNIERARFAGARAPTPNPPPRIHCLACSPALRAAAAKVASASTLATNGAAS